MSIPSPGESGDARTLARRQARERILEAARRVFADYGFATASIARIAEEAGVTKGLVHHYFGSKHDLWEQVKEQWGLDAARAAALDPEADATMDGLTEWVVRSFRFLRANPELIRIRAWAEVEDDYELPTSMLDLERDIDELFRRAQSGGAIRKDIDPIHARAMVHQLIMGWLQSKRFLCPAWGRDPEAERTDDAYLRDMLVVVRAALAPAPAAPTAATGSTTKRRRR